LASENSDVRYALESIPYADQRNVEEDILEETDVEEIGTKVLGPKELARIFVQNRCVLRRLDKCPGPQGAHQDLYPKGNHTTQEDVFFVYVPSSASSLLSIHYFN